MHELSFDEQLVRKKEARRFDNRPVSVPSQYTELWRLTLYQPWIPDRSFGGLRRTTLAVMPERAADESMNEPRETVCR